MHYFITEGYRRGQHEDTYIIDILPEDLKDWLDHIADAMDPNHDAVWDGGEVEDLSKYPDLRIINEVEVYRRLYYWMRQQYDFIDWTKYNP